MFAILAVRLLPVIEDIMSKFDLRSWKNTNWFLPDCPVCGAKFGRPCSAKDWGTCLHPHKERKEKYKLIAKTTVKVGRKRGIILPFCRY